MNVYTEIEKMIIEMNTKILSIAQQNQDLVLENAGLRKHILDIENKKTDLENLVDAYKAKSDLLIERVRPHDSDMWPGDDEILKAEESRGLKLIK